VIEQPHLVAAAGLNFVVEVATWAKCSVWIGWK
jgi:hypothetical protein